MKKLNAIYKFALSSLGLLILALGTPLAAKAIYCPSIRDSRLDRSHYIGVVYEGPPERLNQAVRDYHLGDIKYFMPTGGLGIHGMKQRMIELGVPESRIILPGSYSRDTFENVTTSSRAIKEKNFVNSRRHYSGEKHVPRIKMIVDRLGEDTENDDGYVPVKDGYAGSWFGIPNFREGVACIKDRFLEDLK